MRCDHLGRADHLAYPLLELPAGNHILTAHQASLEATFLLPRVGRKKGASVYPSLPELSELFPEAQSTTHPGKRKSFNGISSYLRSCGSGGGDRGARDSSQLSSCPLAGSNVPTRGHRCLVLALRGDPGSKGHMASSAPPREPHPLAAP